MEENVNPFDVARTEFPGIQYSFFVGGKDQVVIRAATVAEFEGLLGELTDSIEDQPSPISRILEEIQAIKAAAVLVFPGERSSGGSGGTTKGEYRGRGSSSDSGVKCPQCGAEAQVRSGVSAKSGKPWSGTFCTANKEHVIWGR